MREAGEIFFWLLFAAALLLWKPERTNPCLWCPLENTTAGTVKYWIKKHPEDVAALTAAVLAGVFLVWWLFYGAPPCAP